ncbi:hypothetical protein HRbin06_00288 [archaeon HR06]|nr:hypothetical protein HRbin06_00288 [archaeon HR06]
MAKAAILITTIPAKVDEVASKIKKLKGVKELLITTGRVDIVVLTEGGIKDLSSLAREIFKIEGVETTETLVEVE